jgi:hypothetical protein
LLALFVQHHDLLNVFRLFLTLDCTSEHAFHEFLHITQKNQKNAHICKILASSGE